MRKNVLITIDGPAASGKGKISSYISKKWKLKHLDSGILYRALAFRLLKNDINLESDNDIKKSLKFINKISFRKYKQLRNENISKAASKIAIYQSVRNFINKIQQNYVKENIKSNGFVVDGRDIGSKVFKNADLKLYIEVNEQNRAKRRYKQLIDTGEKSIYPQILKEIKLRDKKDMNRKNSPLIIPRGAIIIDNNGSFLKTKNQIKNSFKKLKI